MFLEDSVATMNSAIMYLCFFGSSHMCKMLSCTWNSINSNLSSNLGSIMEFCLRGILIILTTSFTWSCLLFSLGSLSSIFVCSTKLFSTDIESNDLFGTSVSMSGDCALIGSPYAAIGANVDQGSAYVFCVSGILWIQQAKLVASDGAANDKLGYSVSLSGDYALIATPSATVERSAYVFFRSGSVWSQQAMLIASDGAQDDEFGIDVSLSGDSALIGAPYDDIGTYPDQGAAYVFFRSGTIWSQQAKLVASDGAASDIFGGSVCIDGEYALASAQYDVIGANYFQGSVYVFFRSGSVWSQQAMLIASDGAQDDEFGIDVSLSGDIAIVGAHGDDIGTNFDQGSVYVFLRSGTIWNEVAHLIRTNGSAYDYFGNSVAMKNNLIVIGSPTDDLTKIDQGSVRLFTLSGSNWVELMTLIAPDPVYYDSMGTSVSVSNNYVMIGSPLTELGLQEDTGSIYVFFNNSGSWEFACDPGTKLIDGTANCDECVLGKYKDWIGDTCLPCPVGRYSSSTGSLNCSFCETGKYNDVTGQFACLNCPSGKYNSNQESTTISSCLDCPIGKYLPSSGGSNSSDCIDCPVGTYGTISGADEDNDCSECDSVLSGSSSPVGSQNSSSCTCSMTFLDSDGVCSCDVGYGFDGDSCVPCSQDSIKPDVALSTCSSCKSDDPNAVSNINSTVCICEVGFVMADEECQKCDGGMICDEEGSIITSISLETGHWRESSTDLSTRECPYEDACTGSSDISNQCLDGHSGPLCAVCADGYTSANSNSACGKCFEGSHAAAFSVVIIVLAMLVLFLITLSQIDTTKLKSWFDNMKLVMKDRDIRTRFRILLAYFQIIGSFTSVLSSSLPANYSTFLTITQMASLNFGSIFSPRCFNPSINFYDELLVQTIGPILVGIFILLIFIIAAIINPSNRDKARSNFLSRIFLSSFIFFPSASTAVFQVFNCDDDFVSGSSYLKADYRLECDGPEYDGYVGYALLMILVYPIGIPLFYFVCLWLQRGEIRFGEIKQVEIAATSAIAQDSSILSNIQLNDASNSASLKQLSKEVDRRLSIERACLDPVTAPYSSLFGAYKPEYWYWECVECVRRLSLTGLLVFMYPGTEKQVLLAMLICFFYMMLYLSIQPYLESSHSFFMIASQWGILLQLFGIYLIISRSFDATSEAIGGLAVFAGVMVFVWCLASILRVGWSKLNQEVKSSELEVV